jgi:hypothetical protein
MLDKDANKLQDIELEMTYPELVIECECEDTKFIVYASEIKPRGSIDLILFHLCNESGVWTMAPVVFRIKLGSEIPTRFSDLTPTHALLVANHVCYYKYHKPMDVYDCTHFEGQRCLGIMMVPMEELEYVYANPDVQKVTDMCAMISHHIIRTVLSLLGCGNIIPREIVPKTTPKLNRKRMLKGKPPYYSYHVLEIKLTKTQRKHFNGKPSVPLTEFSGYLRQTNRRGTYHSYLNSATGLFGKLKGRWFWSPHIVNRGSPHGTIEKDYDVTTKQTS